MLKRVKRHTSRGISVYDTKRHRLVGSVAVPPAPVPATSDLPSAPAEVVDSCGTPVAQANSLLYTVPRQMLTELGQGDDDERDRERQLRATAERNVGDACRGTAWQTSDSGRSTPAVEFGAPVTTTFTPSTDVATRLTAIGATPLTFHELAPGPAGAEFFHDAIAVSKDGTAAGACVHVYPADEYTGMRLFLTSDQQTGFAVKPDGDIVSVFNRNRRNRKAVASILPLAIQNGGTKLDAFDTVLPRLYAPYGFAEVSRTSWNDMYKPDGWSYEAFASFNGGRPDVVMFAWDACQVGRPHPMSTSNPVPV